MKKRTLLYTTYLVAALIIVAFSNNQMFGQTSPDGIWTIVEQPPVDTGYGRESFPELFSVLTFDSLGLVQLLNTAPMENDSAVIEGITFYFPKPDSTFAVFNIVESPLMLPEDADQQALDFPGIRTYRGQGIDDPTATIRFDLTPSGFHAFVLSGGPAMTVEPHSSAYRDHCISYLDSNYFAPDLQPYNDLADTIANDSIPIGGVSSPNQHGAQLRTYRLAISCTGEFHKLHFNNKSSAKDAIATVWSELNLVFERDFCITFKLARNNAQVIYTNPTTDPYTANNNMRSLMYEGNSNIFNVIGSSNFDVGHTFGTGATNNEEGVAMVGSVCGNSKAVAASSMAGKQIKLY